MRRRGVGPRVASVSAGVLALAVMGGCTGPEAVPTVTVHDEVDWADGVEPSGPDEDDPRVVALRRYDILIKASNNELNFTDPRLAEVTTSEWIEIRAERARGDLESGMFPLWAGPEEMAVSDVIVDGDEATVFMCARRPTWWRWDDDTADVLERARDDAGEFDYATYDLVRQDGRWLVDSYRPNYGPEDGPCDPGPDVAFGTFTTQPDLDLLGTLSPEDVVVPSS